MTDKQTKQATKKLRREAITLQNNSAIKLTMAEAIKQAKYNRSNPDV